MFGSTPIKENTTALVLLILGGSGIIYVLDVPISNLVRKSRDEVLSGGFLRLKFNILCATCDTVEGLGYRVQGL